MQTGAVVLDFGSDSLCLIRFISRIKEEGDDVDLRKLFAIVIGKEVKSSSSRSASNPLTGRITNCGLNGYIRSLEISDDNDIEWDIGGSNATAEDFAATNISIEIPREYFIRYHEPYLPYYVQSTGEGQENISVTEEALEIAKMSNTYDVAMALARRLPTQKSFEYLTSCLLETHNPDRMEFVCEGFRSLDKIYRESADISMRGFQELRGFIERYSDYGSSHEYNKAIVYATESLGYIARENKDNPLSERICSYLIRLAKEEHTNPIHSHIFWSVICSIRHSSVFNTEAQNLKAILDQKKEQSSPAGRGGMPYLDIPEEIINEARNL